MARTALIAAAAVMLWAGDAGAMPCHNAAEITKQLGSKYEEAPVAFGLQSNGNLLQVYSSDKNDTWTLVSTTPNGMSCIIGSGKMWITIPAISGDPMA